MNNSFSWTSKKKGKRGTLKNFSGGIIIQGYMCKSYFLDECEEGLYASGFYCLGVQTGMVESFGLLHSWTTFSVVRFCENTIQTIQWHSARSLSTWDDVLRLQTPTQNLPEVLQQHSFSVQSFPPSQSPVFSLFIFSSALWPPGFPVLVLWMSRDTLSSLSPSTVSCESVTCEQEVVTGLHERIRRHGESGRGPLTGWGQTLSHCWKEKEEIS